MVDHNQVQVLEVSEASDGQRLDNFLFRTLKGLPKSRVYRLIRKGEVRVNRKRCKQDTRLVTGDLVRIPPVRVAQPGTPAKPSPGLAALLLDSILFENDQFLVINKPGGIAVHGGSGVHLGLIEAIRQLKSEWSGLELAHRLDRDTSGCLLIAKNSIFLKEIHRKLKEKEVNKTYLALVNGYWPANLVEVDASLLKNHLQSGERMVKVDKSGKPSVTRFEILERFATTATLIKAMPITGRTHQIRVHCQYGGHAILGDPKYSSPGPGSTSRLCLHAAEIEFQDPQSTKIMKFKAPLSDFMETQLNLLRSKIKKGDVQAAGRT